ncbi:glycosyltransferase [Paraconexibacter antarcticus]|uniref:Glycosyltransferase n=1 Tax=Paraconexibacter antarcticus TaxID=2949664 RepID=A0ABY5DSQ9_9ACTN|nr:glycosyltransferase [Paraconexibacter antarcticus]UTI65048.1 glycosyltransferase [Paraconexibacter antarcticus]
MRVCLIYDCLFPWTVGGAERRMGHLAERLAQQGHDVTYLTRCQWPPDEPPQLPGVRVIAVSRDEPLYGADGNRTIGEPLRFGAGVLRHLLAHGREYDVVHTASFPYFSMLAAGAARRRGGYRLIADWHEVWSASYWRRYVGGPQGRVAHAIQRTCARLPHTAFTFSRLHAERLTDEGLRSEPRIIWEEWADDARMALASADGPRAADTRVEATTVPRSPSVVFAGRLITEKQAPRAVEAIVLAARQVSGLTGTIFGDGPERALVDATIERLDARDVVVAPGFVEPEILQAAMRDALCLLAPSRREGYGLVVIEAAALGVPIVLAAGPDNAATELVDAGVNGVVSQSDDARALADAIVEVHARGARLRASTLAWHTAHLQRVAAQDPLREILAAYAGR